jgi:hypothetical protein
MGIVNTQSEELKPSDETIVCLMLNKAALAQDMQQRYDVRIDVSRAKKSVKVTGLVNNIQACVNEISSIPSAKNDINIEQNMLPFIVGKGGSIVRSLEEGHRVQIDIAREENIIAVLGEWRYLA